MRRKWKKKSLYIASFTKDDIDDFGNKISIYEKPIFIGKENIQPLSGESDIKEFGIKVSKMQKVLLDWTIKIRNKNTVKDINTMPVNELNKMKVRELMMKYTSIDMPIKENDLAYLDGATPENEEIYGDNANYRVDSVRYQNKKVAIYFEKLPNK
jgi:hypothetical protein